MGNPIGPPEDGDPEAVPLQNLALSSSPSDAGPASGRGMVSRRRLALPAALRSAPAGYRASRPAQRTAFRMTTSFAATVAASRAINYVRERRRPMPRLRSAGRLLATVPVSNSIRVHHFLPGLGMGLTSGVVAIFRDGDGWGHWLSVPFGIGLALVADELPLLAGRSNPYWGNELFSFVQGGVAAAASAVLAGQFIYRGRRLKQAPTWRH